MTKLLVSSLLFISAHSAYGKSYLVVDTSIMNTVGNSTFDGMNQNKTDMAMADMLTMFSILNMINVTELRNMLNKAERYKLTSFSICCYGGLHSIQSNFPAAQDFFCQTRRYVCTVFTYVGSISMYLLSTLTGPVCAMDVLSNGGQC